MYLSLSLVEIKKSNGTHLHRALLEQGKLKTNLNYQPKSIFYAWISNQIIWVTVWGCFWVLFSSRLRLRDWIESNPIKLGSTYFKTQSNAAAGPSTTFTQHSNDDMGNIHLNMYQYPQSVSRVALWFIIMIYNGRYVFCELHFLSFRYCTRNYYETFPHNGNTSQLKIC